MILRLLECLCDLYPRLAPEHQKGVMYLRPDRIEIVPSHIRWMQHPEAKGYYTWMRIASPRVH